MSAEEVAKAFTAHFYQTFDAGAQGLAGLYNEQSMLTFEGQQHQGAQAVIAKLQGCGPVQHVVKSMDVQPSSNQSAILIFVTGTIKIGGDNPLHFCEMFQLVSTGPGAYYVHNDVFRLNYGL
uniref:Nuclear transport factor 2 n=1 Tax=Odontella aurita TaxID=265563 RepID=A0A7S4MNW5_9STRA|mmetsp:Transcript_27252/g.80332  ORF Transcript_27252/g.80332 Transcript_27252/m.80332 type:complete len:122 (+) Transcript_27252:208-573(+)|eukprot:CAMPEP_0113560264 /NCGR_PEP_ID=MMETSP0015_2-20120614/19336_1 /TAXON_ID=2838 /ORGANISM="Odontella" /LENGTH=121 /DNA_ID=CAMNT_0000461953 /DNA_START=39 /DNA_END=404 /DNA_ORIENTATION=+ /assembly_acc=CAM_ASM_000160